MTWPVRGYGGISGGQVFGGAVYVRDRLGPWRVDAKCLGMDMDIFFPTPGESNRPAKQICVTCDVRDECLEYAIKRPHISGVWGATSEREREHIRWQRRHP